MKDKHLTWVVVADNCRAKIYRLVRFPKIEEIVYLEHPASRLHNRDLTSTTPGRSFESTGSARHAYQPAVEPKEMEAIKFAVDLAQYLSEAEKKGEFERLYLMAEPSFLGLLRKHLTSLVEKTIIAEIAKELTTQDIEAVEYQLQRL